LYQYHRAAAELWKFCWACGGSSHLEFVAGLIDDPARWREGMAVVPLRVGIGATCLLLVGCGASVHDPADSVPTVPSSPSGVASSASASARSVSSAPSSASALAGPGSFPASSAIAAASAAGTASPALSSDGLAPVDSTLQPARPCFPEPAAVVTITINPDTPQPDCVIVTKTQRLQVVNATNAFDQPGTVITVSFAGLPVRTLRIGESTSYDTPFGKYLAPGQHYMQSSKYPGSNIVIWLK
jgi:hypothetical protein